MTANEIRAKFLDFFRTKDHHIAESSALVPHDDPTLLFTNAGMVQFKRVFMGEERRNYVRAATSQRCVRAGGKHNDLENVGYTARHHTFFEMLGNFSFGDYFKQEAIELAWEFLTEVLQLPKDRLWVSVFEEDDEAYDLWKKIDGLPEDRIVRLGEKDNFWAMGDTGPCGPCSEIHIDQGPEVGCGTPECKVGCEHDCDRYLELWNLVFMQFYRDENGTMTPLPKPSIDTGMGLERISAVVQGRHSNYESDLFTGLIGKISSLTGKHYGDNDRHDTAMRVIADHCRTTTFLVADGVLPSNEGRGYVLRRIMRRAIRFGRLLGFNRPFMAGITSLVIEQMGAAYPHLKEASELLDKVVRNEEERFLETLDNGLSMLNTEMARLKESKTGKIPGTFIFTLYDTFGFPVDIVQDVAQEEGMDIDKAGFASAMEEQRLRSKKSWKEGGLAALANGVRALMDAGHKTRFVGYDEHQTISTIGGMIDTMGEAVSNASKGEKLSIFCPETPFYAESGGQFGDQGEILAAGGQAQVMDTITVGDGLILHEVEVVSGSLSVGDKVEMRVAEGRRQKIANNHTATHILHAALRKVLGSHVKQSGSLVTPDRLRFDFTHFSPLTEAEISQIELIANREIRLNTPVCTEILTREEAIESGATALFGEKYAEKVRVVAIDVFSKELCGGTHVNRTGEIGLLKISSETGIAAGVRRIEAVTGERAFTNFQQLTREIGAICSLLKSTPDDTYDKINALLARQKDLEKELGRLTAKLTLADLETMIGDAQTINGIKVVIAEVPINSAKTLREVGDRIRDKLVSGVVVLGGVSNQKASLITIVTKDLTQKLQAGNIIREIAAIVGGKGGGRPDMAQAGGSMADRLPEALASVTAIIKKQME